MIPRFFVSLSRKIKSALRALVLPKGKPRRGPDDGSQGAGVPARLKPPPPVLSAAAANALLEPEANEAV